MTAKMYGVGIGPGDPELLTLKAQRIIEECPVIATPETGSGATLALDIASQATNIADKEIIKLSFAMSRDPKVLEESHQQAANKIIEELAAGNDVAMLNLGDVNIFATYNYLKPLVEKAGYEVISIPGVPSFCAVAATLETNLTPEMNTPLHIVPAGFSDFEAALNLPGTKVIMKAGKPLGDIKRTLKAVGMYEKASLVQNCGLPDEKVAVSLDDIEENNGYFTTMVVRP